MFSSRFLLAVAFVAALGCFLFPARAPAQDKIPFNPSEHLEGYDEASFSIYTDLYDLDSFEALEGRKVTPAELEEIQAKWKKELDRVNAEIRKIEADPMARSLYRLDRQMKRHRYFSRIDCVVDSSHQPVVLYLQKLQKPLPGHMEKTVKRYGPMLKGMAERFQEEFADPLDLKPRHCAEAHTLIVLSSYGDYMNFYKSTTRRGIEMYAGYYDPFLNVAVTYSDPFHQSKTYDKYRISGPRFVLACALLHAYYDSPDPVSHSAWLFGGMAEYLALLEEGSKSGRTYADLLQDMGSLLKDPVRRHVFFLNVPELLEVKTESNLGNRVEPLFGALKKKNTDWSREAVKVFRKESALFIRFLLEGEEGRYRKIFEDFMRAALAEKGLIAAKSQAFAGLSLDQLHKEFVAFLGKELKSFWPNLALSESDRKILLSMPMKAEAFEKGDVAPIAAEESRRSKILDPDFQPAVLAPKEVPIKAALGMALLSARDGAIQSALETIRNLEASRLPRSFQERVARERRRIQALEGLRDSFLQTMAEQKKNLRIDHEGKSHVGKVEIGKDDTIRLVRSRSRTTTLPKDALECEELLKRLREKRLDLGRNWVGGYASLLTGGKTWDKHVTGADPEAAQLLMDAEDIESCLEEGAIYRTLLNLARFHRPNTPEEASTVLEAIEELLDSHLDAPLVREKKAALRQLAAHALARRFDALEFQEKLSFHGKIESLPDGRVRLLYEFDDPAELEDFEPEDYLADWRKDFVTIQTDKEDSGMEIDDGSLAAWGQACRRLQFGLKAPLKITYDVLVSSKGYEDAEMLPAGTFFVGLCDDGFGSYIKCIETGALWCLHKKSRFFKESDIGDTYASNTPYHIEVVHDGERVTSFVDNVADSSLPAGPLQSGGLFLWIHFDCTTYFKRISFEGALDEEYLMKIRDGWIEERLEALPQ